MPNNPRAQNPFPGPATIGGIQPIAGTCGEGDFVTLVNGNLVKTETLFNIATVGLPLAFGLTYNSQETVLGPVGHFWRHNLMMSLLVSGSPPNQVTFVSNTGRQYGFVLSDSVWVPDGQSCFISATLAASGTDWQLTWTDGSSYLFDAAGRLIALSDSYGNTNPLSYTNFDLSTYSEPTGRAIVLGYTDTWLTSVTDPNGNLFKLVYDTTHANLTMLVAPGGCAITFSYATPSNHLLTSRTDGLDHTVSYAYDDEARLVSATDAEDPSHTITYVYDTVSEVLGSDITATLSRTTLTDARSNAWQYIFDLFGNMRRIIDPLGHQRKLIWDGNQQLIYDSAGFTYPIYAPYDVTYNRFRRSATDNAGNQLYYYDATGRVDRMTYDANRNLLSKYVGQAHLGVGGNWQGQYGGDGYLFCAFNADNSDLSNLPSYVSSITFGTPAPTRTNISAATSPDLMMDPRALTSPTSLRRAVGFWVTATGTAGATFSFDVNLTGAASFNLSLYTNSVDNGYRATSPLVYNEQMGRDVVLTVTDSSGSQPFHVYNNAPGAWVSFPVSGDASHPISVTVAMACLNTVNACISAIAFDPYDSHQSTYTYNDGNDVLTATDPLANETVFTYNSNGTRATATNARGFVTSYFYTDTHLNLTRIEDAMTPTPGNTYLTYDNNGNVLSIEDANGHLWQFEYDGRNRKVAALDPLGHLETWTWDAAGNLSLYTNQNGQETQYFYTPSNRLQEILDALSNSTQWAYDGSGNMLQVTDARSNVTQFQWDTSERLAQITLPDETVVTQAYDALDQLVAVTSANGNGNLSTLNVAGASNMLDNGSADIVSPLSTSQARNWTATPTSGSNVRDTTVSHSGAASLKLSVGTGPQYWSQFNVGLPPGVTAVLNYWARPDDTSTTITTQTGILMLGFNGNSTETDSSTTTLPTSSTSWVQSAWQRLAVPGDSQAVRFTTPEVRAYGSAASTATVWFDDFELYALSTALMYDLEGRLLGTQGADGAQSTTMRDRWGRVVLAVDARGYISTFTYDANDRMLSATDALDDETAFAWDAVGNLQSVTDPNDNEVQYDWDPLNRLSTITYPDTTTELFAYDAVSNLTGYTNGRGQSRSLSYDAANRPVEILYATDSTTVLFQYDGLGNVLSRIERNGDIRAFVYDALNRLIEGSTSPGASSATVGTFQQSVYDAVSNRTEFLNAGPGPVFDGTGITFDNANFTSAPSAWWTVPSPGYDVMNRLPAYQDAASNETTLSYDNESRLVGITYPNGSPNVTSSATYDVVSKMLSQDTAMGDTDILPLGYGYDLSANRISTVASDTQEYGIDAAGRLTQVDLNRLVERSVSRFSQGTLAATEVDPSTGLVGLLPFADTFDGTVFNVDRWRLAYAFSEDVVGIEIRQNNGLGLAFPRGYCSLMLPSDTNEIFGLVSSYISYGAEHRTQVTGDFDIQVDFSEFQAGGTFGGIQLQVSNAPLELSPSSYARMALNTQAGWNQQVQVDGSLVKNDYTSTSATSGAFRITRTGASVTLYYDDGDGWVGDTYATFVTSALYVSLYAGTTTGVNAGLFQNFINNTSSLAYPSSGTYTSTVYDAGATVTWDAISWDATVPAGSSLEFQVAVSSSLTGPFTYVGPDGTSGTSFTTSGTSLAAETSGRYATYQATFTGDTTTTATLGRVDVTFERTNPSTEYTYGYDTAGNMVSKVTEVAGEPTVTETRTVNSLNQITANAVVTGNSTVNWTYTFDASGNEATKSDGTNVTTYTWDDDNRLTQVVLPGNVTIGYTYDVTGRMQTRTDATGTATFVWDGMDCIQETDSGGNLTRYYCPNGVLMSFDRTLADSGDEYDVAAFDVGTYDTTIGATVTYQLHADALGSVRKVTGPDGSVVSTYDYDAWGEQLGSTSDGVPGGGLAYRFVGAYGVRWDAATGLYYMRARWYDPQLGRFLSRDDYNAASSNLYQYASNNPARQTDPYGLISNDASYCARALVRLANIRIAIDDRIKDLANNPLKLRFRSCPAYEGPMAGDILGHLGKLAIWYADYANAVADYIASCSNFGPPPPWVYLPFPQVIIKYVPGDPSRPNNPPIPPPPVLPQPIVIPNVDIKVSPIVVVVSAVGAAAQSVLEGIVILSPIGM